MTSAVPKTVFSLPLISLSLLVSGLSPATIQSKSLNGLWLSDGYGLFVEFNYGGLQTYEITSISCIPSRNAKRSDVGNAGVIVFRSGHETIRVVPDAKPNFLRMHMDGTASSIVLHRIAIRPEICRGRPNNTPQQNYAIFWQTFAEQYPFFALHKVDWNAADKEFRLQISANSKPDELFQIFRKMIEPLQDSHTGLEASNIGAEFDGWRNDPNHLDEHAWKRAASVIETKYVRGGLRAYCRDHIQFGSLGRAIGYLRVTTFYDYADVPAYAAELQCLQKSLDLIFDSSIKFNGLVIDVRLNHGGDDPLGIEIASRLTDKKYLAYSKIARNNTDLNAPLHFTEPQPTWVMPTARPGFKGRVVLLIGPDTVSAGETFAMALLDRNPRIRLIGLNTQGVFSDILSRSLPNGWRFHLPNEVYLTSEGKAFDGTGVPPDTRVPFFSEADLQNGKDATLEEAIKQLAN
jgi:Peptidase family S41/Tricorn protease C1 domain